jgi:hypothetical protein
MLLICIDAQPESDDVSDFNEDPFDLFNKGLKRIPICLQYTAKRHGSSDSHSLKIRIDGADA